MIVRFWSDLLCPFAYIALHRLAAARERLGVAVEVEHHAFVLELFDGPRPRRGTDSEAAALGGLVPDLELRLWTGPDDRYPHTVLLAAEAVLAAKAQGNAAAEALDRALRRAFWTGSRSIGVRGVILDVAAETGGVDVADLAARLDRGAHRAELMADHAVARSGAISGSPTLVLPDGETVTNPGLAVHWEGPFAVGYPVVDRDDPTVFDELLERASG